MDTNNSAHMPLVETHELARHLDDPSWVPFDCRFNLSDPTWGGREYAKGHIPSALYAHLDYDLSSPIGPRTGRHPLPDSGALMEKLGNWGVDTKSRVIAYDDAGGAFAVRLWWLLRWLGHQQAAVLNGGLKAWIADGYSIDQSVPTPQPKIFEGMVQNEAWITTETLARQLGTDHYLVVDARVPERFRGEIEPIDPIAGHIPGAINMPLTDNLDQEGRFISPELLRTRFLAALGTTRPDRAVHQCGSGVNACHNLLAMELAGLSGSKLYAGSWSEWIRSPKRPILVGGE